MYVMCSECGWKPDDFLDLTRRQLNAIMKGREIWFRQKQESEEDANNREMGEVRRQYSGRKTPTSRPQRINSIRYDSKTGRHALGSGALSQHAKDTKSKTGTIRPNNVSDVFDGLAQGKSVQTRVWRGGVKKENRPKTIEEKIERIRQDMKNTDQSFGIDKNAS